MSSNWSKSCFVFRIHLRIPWGENDFHTWVQGYGSTVNASTVAKTHQAYLQTKGSDLLDFCVTERWEFLCESLDVEVPDDISVPMAREAEHGK